jgi:hypothetical protein
MHEFVAEQYRPRTEAELAEHGASAARLAAELLTREGTPVEFVRSIFIPDDETSMFTDASIEAMRAALAAMRLRFERVSEAVTQTGTRFGGDAAAGRTPSASNQRRA